MVKDEERISHISFLTLILITLLMTAMPVHAQDDAKPAANGPAPQELVVIDRGTVKEVLRSDMIMLDDNRRYRLDNIRVPPYEDAACHRRAETRVPE